MPVNPTDVRVKSYNANKAFRASMGATAIQCGQLCKYSSNLIVPCVDNEENVRTYVALENVAVSSTNGILVVPFADAIVELGYTGTPTEGTDYGISGPGTVDATNTTQLLVTVVKVNTARTTVDVIEYQIGS